MLQRSSTARAVRRFASAGVAAALVVSLAPGATALPASDEVRRDLDRAQDRLDEIDQRLSLAVEEYNEAQVQLEEITQRLDTTRGRLQELRADQQVLRDAVADHVRRLYKMGPALELSTIIVAGSPSDAGVKSWTMRRILDQQRTDLEALDANRTSIDAVQARELEEQRQARERTERQEDARVEVETLFAESEDDVQALNALLRESVAEEERLAEEARLRREAEAAAAARERERRAAREAASPPAPSAPAPSAPAPSAPAPSAPAPSAPAPSAPAPSAPAPSTRQSAAVAVQTAVAQLGKPYQWAGSGPNSFDCSGLTSFAWRAAGVTIPRTSRAQYAGTKRISRADLQPGDLVFYHSPISHVAMYIGGGKVVEAPNSGNNVRIRSDGLTRRGVVGYGRI